MKTARKILFIVIMAGIGCVAAGVSLLHGYKHYNAYRFRQLDELYKGHTPYDILYLGSSRTHTAINPVVIDSLLGTRSFNAGAEGTNIYEIRMVLDGYLETHIPPKIVVVTVDRDFTNRQYNIFDPTLYYSYPQNKKVAAAMAESGYAQRIFDLLPALSVVKWDDYHRSQALRGMVGKVNYEDPARDLKGYVPNGNDTMTDAKMAVTDPYLMLLDTPAFTASKRILDDIAATCRQGNITLVLTYAPEFNNGHLAETNDTVATIRYIDSFARAQQISYWRHDRLDICRQRSLFANYAHLNTAGGIIYAYIIAAELKPILKKRTVATGAR